jgi:hypothetical protein
MKTKRFFILIFMFMFIFGEVSKADQIPIATTLKQGIYNVSPEHEGLYRNIKLITPDKAVTITVLDSNGAQKLFVKLDNVNEHLKVGPIKKGETIIVTGEGEISIIH